MNKKFLLSESNTYVNYTIKTNSRAKKLILKVTPAGAVSLTVPSGTSALVYETFLKSHSSWLHTQLSKVEQVTKPRMVQRKQYLEAKTAVLKLSKARLAHFNQHYKFAYNRITVRDQYTRWGSCSNTGTLSFNYRIIYLEESLQDYIFVHELCHLKEMNHSQDFWDLVGQTIPNYKYLRRKLKRYEVELF